MKAQEVSSVSDDALMLDVSNGQVGKLGVLFDRNHRKLFDFFIRMTRSREVSEDLVQDVFFRILKYRATFRAGSRFTTWMYHIARNARIDHREGALNSLARQDSPLVQISLINFLVNIREQRAIGVFEQTEAKRSRP